MRFFKIFTSLSIGILTMLLNFSSQGMPLEEKTEKNAPVCLAIVPYSPKISSKKLPIVHFLRPLPSLVGEYQLFGAPLLKKMKHDYALEKFRTFLKEQGVILRDELNTRDVTRQKRIGKSDPMLLSSDGRSFFWCNESANRIEHRSLEDPSCVLKVFPMRFPQGYKFSFLSELDDTQLLLEIAKSERRNTSYNGKLFGFDTVTGALTPFEEEGFFADDFYVYKQTPRKIFVTFGSVSRKESSSESSSRRHKWVIFDLVQGTRSVVGNFSKDPGFPTFDAQDRPLFSIFFQKNGEQTVFRIIQGPLWRLEPFYALGKEIYNYRRICGIDPHGNIYMRVRGQDLDHWTLIKRTKKGAFSSESPLFEAQEGDIKDAFVYYDMNRDVLIFYKHRYNGRKTLQLHPDAPPSYKKLKEALEQLQEKNQGDFSGVDHSPVTKYKKTPGIILAREQGHRPMEYVLLSLGEQGGEVRTHVFTPSTSLKFPWERFQAVETVTIPTQEGFQMPAYIIPPNLKALFGKKPPLFVHIHGGPHAKDTYSELDSLSQYLASLGFSVLKVNYPGSTGSGLTYEEFSDGNWDKIPGFIKQAIDWMICHKNVDFHRVAVGGVSFGATMAVNMVARFPETVKLAIACNGTYDYPLTVMEAIGEEVEERTKSGTFLKTIKSLHEPEDTIKQIGGDPRIPEQKEALIQKSVYPYIPQITGRIILCAGLEDANCIPRQSEKLAKALEAAGKRVQYLTFKGRGHGLENRVSFPQEEVDQYSFSAWNAVGIFATQALHKEFGTLYEPAPSHFYEELETYGIKSRTSKNWD